MAFVDGSDRLQPQRAQLRHARRAALRPPLLLEVRVEVERPLLDVGRQLGLVAGGVLHDGASARRLLESSSRADER